MISSLSKALVTDLIDGQPVDGQPAADDGQADDGQENEKKKTLTELTKGT